MNARSLAITRAVAVIGGTGALIVAATFAAASSNPVTISGISLASSDVNVLQVFDFQGGSYATDTSQPSVNGSGINLNLTTTDSALQPFYLQNSDATDTLAISAMASIPGSGALDPSNVEVTFWDDSATPVQLGQATLASLESTSVPFSGGDLAPGAAGDSGQPHVGHAGNFNVSFKLINPATSFDTLTGLQLQFTGTPL